MSENEQDEQDERRDESALCEKSVRAVRLGHGANCSSVGSVIDTLFLGAAFGGAIVAAVLAAMKVEPVTVVGGEREQPEEDDAAGRREGT